MELKVWVDGIQRVVCGANYNTTCQEVVIALASAMGQIGHFTLVERWRDTERPLILNECPLQSLCKWGEYAGEVRFYLVQADKIEYQGKNQQKWKVQTQKLNGFEHNFSPLRSSQHDQAQSRSKSLKRSSTFSGAHIVNYAALASLSSASSQKPVPASVSNSFNQLMWVASSSSTTKNDHTNHDLIQNGKLEGLLAYSFSGLVSATDHPRSDRIREYSVCCGMEVHTGKITESPMNLSSQIGTYSSSFEQSPSPQSFQQFHHPNQHLSHRHSTGPYAASSKQTNQKPSQNNSTTITRQPSSSQKLQHSSLSQLSFPQNKCSHHKHSQNHSTSMHVESENVHVNKKNHQEPVLQKRLQENISKPALSSRHREKSHDRKAQGTMPSSNSSEFQSHSTTFFSETSDCISKQATVIDATYYSNSKGRIPYEHSESSLDKTVQHMINLKDSLESHFGNRTKSMTIDKAFSSFKPGNGFNSDAHNTDPNNHPIKSSIRRQHGQLRPETEVSKFGRSGEVDKISISDLTVTEQQGADTELKSSFASAVAHIHQCGNDHLNIFKTEGHLKEYILSVDKDSYSYVAEIAESDEASPIQHLDLIKLSHNVLSDHQKYKHNPVKSSSKLQVPVSISFSQHNSAFKEVFPKYNHQESSSPLLYASAEYNMDNLGNNQFGLHIPSSSHQNHDGSQSSETSLEIEEYNLDKNFPDILHRDVPDMEIIRGDKLACTSLKGQLIGSEQGGHTDSQYQLLLKILSVQQARMKIQQSQINDANSEIKNYEKEVSNDNVKLDIFKAEASEFEKLELEVKAELEDLEKTEWVHVMDNEQKWEVDIKLQLQSLRDKLEQVELQIRHLIEEAEAKSQHLKTEKKKIEEEKKKNEELKKKSMIEVPQLKEQLTNLNKTINENEKKLREVERGIYDADVDLKKQEDKIKALEAEFKDERYIDNQTNPPSEELPSISSVSQAPIKRHPSSENGEAILKILERQLSPRFLTGDGDNSLGGVISAQHIYRSALAIENPNGVWV